MSKLIIMRLISIIALFVLVELSCGMIVPELTDEDVLKIYALREFSNDVEVYNELIFEYQLDVDSQQEVYRSKLLEIAKDQENWEGFSRRAIDFFVDREINYTTETKLYKTDAPKPQLGTFAASQEISEEESHLEDRFVKVFYIYYGTPQKRRYVHKVEYYENQFLQLVSFFSEDRTKALRADYFNELDELVDRDYFDYILKRPFRSPRNTP